MFDTNITLLFNVQGTEDGETYRSWVWKHYERVQTDGKVTHGKCLIDNCGALIKRGSDGSTKPLVKHLAS